MQKIRMTSRKDDGRLRDEVDPETSKVLLQR